MGAIKTAIAGATLTTDRIQAFRDNAERLKRIDEAKAEREREVSLQRYNYVHKVLGDPLTRANMPDDVRDRLLSEGGALGQSLEMPFVDPDPIPQYIAQQINKLQSDPDAQAKLPIDRWRILTYGKMGKHVNEFINAMESAEEIQRGPTNQAEIDAANAQNQQSAATNAGNAARSASQPVGHSGQRVNQPKDAASVAVPAPVFQSREEYLADKLFGKYYNPKKPDVDERAEVEQSATRIMAMPPSPLRDVLMGDLHDRLSKAGYSSLILPKNEFVRQTSGVTNVKPLTPDQIADNDRLARTALVGEIDKKVKQIEYAAQGYETIEEAQKGTRGLREELYDLKAKAGDEPKRQPGTLPKNYGMEFARSTTVDQDRRNERAVDRIEQANARIQQAQTALDIREAQQELREAVAQFKMDNPTGGVKYSRTDAMDYQGRRLGLENEMQDLSDEINGRAVDDKGEPIDKPTGERRKSLLTKWHRYERELKAIKAQEKAHKAEAQGGGKSTKVEVSADKGVEQWRTLVAKHFPANAVDDALKVMGGESGGNPQALNKNKNGSTDHGLMQINSVHGYDKSKLNDPEQNIRIAAAMFKKSGWQPWVAAKKLGLVGKKYGKQSRESMATADLMGDTKG